MKNAHTPSPWQFRKSESGIYITTAGAIFRRQKGEDIPSTEQRANALLISKAPEMLDFLQSIVSDYEKGLIEDIEHVAIRAEQLIKSATQG